ADTLRLAPNGIARAKPSDALPGRYDGLGDSKPVSFAQRALRNCFHAHKKSIGKTPVLFLCVLMILEGADRQAAVCAGF
ncbi:MAG: hypothetical protein ACI4MP_08450, partial [Candidatus Ventricola sp.]